MNQLKIMLIMSFAAMLGAIGQIMLKLASEKSFSAIKVILQNWPLYLFAFAYGLAVIINIWAYKMGGKTSIIYPTIALSYVFASIIAWKFFGEQISSTTWAGITIIVLGVAIVGLGGGVLENV